MPHAAKPAWRCRCRHVRDDFRAGASLRGDEAASALEKAREEMEKLRRMVTVTQLYPQVRRSGPTATPEPTARAPPPRLPTPAPTPACSPPRRALAPTTDSFHCPRSGEARDGGLRTSRFASGAADGSAIGGVWCGRWAACSIERARCGGTSSPAGLWCGRWVRAGAQEVVAGVRCVPR
jgi:hypothetical protein